MFVPRFLSLLYLRRHRAFTEVMASNVFLVMSEKRYLNDLRTRAIS